MQLKVECPGCRKHIEVDESLAGQTSECPSCAEKFSIPQRVREARIVSDPAASETPDQEQVLYDESPSMFRNRPVGFAVTCILCFAVVGLVIFLIWWLRCLGTKLTVTTERTILRKGLLSKRTNEVFHSDVRNIQVSQGFLQRLFDVGSIGIASSGQSDIEIQVAGMPSPEKVKEIINKHRRD